ncbi:MAG TPA: DsbC family protein [Gallionella sp.]|nr:DsbC family protein [Gallionella sp.]
MKKLIALFAAALLSSSVHAGESEIRQSLQNKFPNIGKIEHVVKTPYSGLYEVIIGDQLLYTDAKGEYLFDGHVIELKNRRDITEERRRVLFAIDFDKLPFDIAIKRVKGDGSRRMAYFTDPNCGYCRKLEKELGKIDNVTLYMFVGPIFSPASEDLVRNVKCAKDPIKAWNELMLNGNAPASASCNTKTDKVMALAKKMNVNGTPNLIFGDGVQVPGYLPAEELEKRLDASRKK